MSEPVPRHRRNPRRAYTREGVEIPPATVGSCLATEAPTILVFCHACENEVVLGIEGLPPRLAIPDLPGALRLRCRCGSRSLGVMADMAAHYAVCGGAGRSEEDTGPPQARVVPWRDLIGAERAAAIAGS